MTSRIKLLSIASLFTLALLAGCDQQGPAEQAGETIDNAAQQTGDAVNNAADNAGDAIQDHTQNQ